MKILKIGNSLVLGVVHYDMGDVKVVVNYVKKYFEPNERIVFMGEGGDDNNNYVKGSEQEIIYKELNSYFKNLINDSWDGADLNVMNDQSTLYKLQKEKTGLSHNQILASNWASMVGQNKSLDDFNPQHYLNSEGIEFLKREANEADLPLSDDLNNPTDEDFNTLYRLSFPNDHGDKHTKVGKVADVFNEIRDHNLLNKLNQYQNKGYKVIATVGEGHIDLIKNIKKESNQNKMVNEKENLKGGLADGKTIQDVAKKHKIDVDLLKLQLQNGIKVEKEEHTDNKKSAKEIALDHLWEDPTYYIKLKKVETKEMDSGSSGSFEAPLFAITKKKLQEEVLGTGEFDVPFLGKSPKGRKNPLKIGGPDTIYKNRAVKDKKWPRFGGPKGVYVKVKEKCKKFPYCNQGNTGALEFIHEDKELQEAIKETSKKYGIPYSDMENIVLNEINKIFI
jgi:hypothetical protein